MPVTNLFKLKPKKKETEAKAKEENETESGLEKQSKGQVKATQRTLAKTQY